MSSHISREAFSSFLPASLYLLGGVRLYLGRRIITRFPAGKSLQLLAFLALHPGTTHERTFLADLLWPDVLPETGRARLSVALNFLRGLLEDRTNPVNKNRTIFAADRATLCLLPHQISTDVADFERLLDEAEREKSLSGMVGKNRLGLIGNALRGYGGNLLPGLVDDWIEAERVRLSASHENALAEWSSLTRRPPPRPISPGSRMRDSGLGAATALSALEAAPSTPASAEWAGGGKDTLPPRLTRLIGRDASVQKLRCLSREKARLVTLVGPGGVGKTRLLQEAASGETDHPVVWVPLADLSEPDGLAASVANALRLSVATDSKTALGKVIHALNAVPALLLLDNAEHLRDGVADFVSNLLTYAPTTNIWVTSRVPLDVVGERLFPVAPLSLPPDQTEIPEDVEASDACALFVDRAQMVRPDFGITHRNTAAIARLCRRLDGMPLALELAAARVQTTSLGQILQSVQNGTQTLSASTRRGLPDRHRSLHAVLAWSVRLLSPQTARFLFSLSVFRGGWTSEAAEAVTCDALVADRLAELVSASLVVAEEQRNGVVRFRLLETVRDYARSELDRLGEAVHGEVRDRHLTYFTDFADRAFEGWIGDSWGWMLRLLPEEDNLLAALECACNVDPKAYLNLAGALAHYVYQSRNVLINHLNQALALAPAADSSHRARALHALYSCHLVHGTEERFRTLLTDAIAMTRRLNEARLLARLLCGDVDDEQAQDEAIRLYSAHGTTNEKAVAIQSRAVSLWRCGKVNAAEEQFSLAQQLRGSDAMLPSLMQEWGYFLLCRGELRRAEMMLQSSVEATERLDERFTEHGRRILAATRVGLGYYTAARADAERVIAGQRFMPPSFSTVIPRRVAASACIGLSDWEGAEAHLHQALSDLLAIDAGAGSAYIGGTRAELCLARGDTAGALVLAYEAFAMLYKQAGCPDLSNAPYWTTITAVNTRSILAWAEAHSGLWDAAWQGFSDVLRFRHRLGLYNGVFGEVEGLALVHLQSGDAKRATHLFAASATLRLRTGTVSFPHQAYTLAARIAPLRADTALQNVWQDGQNLSLDQMITVALGESRE